MRSTRRSSILLTSTVLSGLALACSGAVGLEPGRVDCESAELAPTYGAALSWSAAVGESGSVPADMPSDLDTVDSEASGQCALAGVRQGLAHGRGRRSHKGHRHDGHGHCDGGGDATCRNDGRVTGDVAASLYCDLSVLLGGLGPDNRLPPGPADRCSRSFEEECRKRFDRATRARADCAPFLANGAFAEAFQTARFNQCLFSIGTGEPDPQCEDGVCECSDKKSCDLSCTGPGCDVSCEDTRSCTASCGDDCNAACKDVGTCTLQTGRDASVVCEHARECELSPQGGQALCRKVDECDVIMSEQGEVTCERTRSCDVECAECDVSCVHVGRCRVKLAKGRVKCDRHSKRCDVTCEDGKRPKRCKDGSFVCGESCS